MLLRLVMAAGRIRLRESSHGELMSTTHKEIAWERDFDAAAKRGGGKHLLVDFSAAPM